MFQPKIR